MKHWKTLLLSLITGMALSTLGAIPAGNITQSGDTTTPIQHIIVVMQQNHTFDNYFGTYSKADGIPAGTCLPISLSDSTNKSCVAPFHMGDYPMSDLIHGAQIFSSDYNSGQMNGFVDALYKR